MHFTGALPIVERGESEHVVGRTLFQNGGDLELGVVVVKSAATGGFCKKPPELYRSESPHSSWAAAVQSQTRSRKPGAVHFVHRHVCKAELGHGHIRDSAAISRRLILKPNVD